MQIDFHTSYKFSFSLPLSHPLSKIGRYGLVRMLCVFWLCICCLWVYPLGIEQKTVLGRFFVLSLNYFVFFLSDTFSTVPSGRFITDVSSIPRKDARKSRIYSSRSSFCSKSSASVRPSALDFLESSFILSSFFCSILHLFFFLLYSITNFVFVKAFYFIIPVLPLFL